MTRDGSTSPLLVSAAQERRVVDAIAAKLVEGVRVRIEVQHPHRPVPGERPQDGQRDGVIAADRDGDDAVAPEIGEERLDHLDRPLLAHRIDRGVAQIRDVADLEGLDEARRMHPADHPRRLAHPGRTLTRAGAVVDPDVERHPDEADVDGVRDLVPAGAHERRDVRESRNQSRIDRLKIGMSGHVSALRKESCRK